MPPQTILTVDSADTPALRRFITLERALMGAHEYFTSEPDADMVKRLSGRSAFFKDNMDSVLYIAQRDGRDVARCSALVNRRYQAAKGEAVGFIGFFAAAPDCGDQVAAMLAEAEAWLRARGVTRIIAPYNGSPVLGLGLLTAAFDENPMFPMPWTPPYYVDYITAAGFAPRYPLWVYSVDFTSAAYQRLKRRAADNTTVTVRPIDKKRWTDEIDLLRRLLNETFVEEWEFYPMTPGEFHEFFDQVKPILDARQILFAEVNGEPAGWCFGFPDWSRLFRSFKGKVGPIQILKLLLFSGRYDRAGLVGIGVPEAAKGQGVSQCLAAALYQYYEGRGLTSAFYYPVNEHNTRSRKFAESIGGTGRALMTCYDKSVT